MGENALAVFVPAVTDYCSLSKKTTITYASVTYEDGATVTMTESQLVDSMGISLTSTDGDSPQL